MVERFDEIICKPMRPLGRGVLHRTMHSAIRKAANYLAALDYRNDQAGRPISGVATGPESSRSKTLDSVNGK